MQIYNADVLDHGKRFYLAAAAGLLAAVVLGNLYGFIISILRVQAVILYLFIGWLIGEVIKKYGHGVHTKFCILGAACTFLAVFIGDICSVFGNGSAFVLFLNPANWLMLIRVWASMYLSVSLNGILGLILRAVGIYAGYTNSVIL